jgi:1-phosphofructokinase
MVIQANSKRSIVTIGFCPCWDMTYYCNGLDWGDHRQVSKPALEPAGKALNVSKALAWMGNPSTAAGLWGQEDCEEALKGLEKWAKYIKPSFTLVPGRTRRNLTLVDGLYHREIHLREPSELNSNRALQELRSDLDTIVGENSLCVFAGSFPDDKFLNHALAIIQDCQRKNSRVVMDSSGTRMKKALARGSTWLIKPNVRELSELVGENIPNRVDQLSQAGKLLLNRVEIILISRGEKGAIILSQDAILRGRSISSGPRVVSTVGCGDYLLAGFLRAMTEKQNLRMALKIAVQAATAKAWGWSDSMPWSQVASKIKVNIC